jgi:hypothetical protein
MNRAQVTDLNRNNRHWDTRRYSTGSDSDLVLAVAAISESPGRYRSLYYINLEFHRGFGDRRNISADLNPIRALFSMK